MFGLRGAEARELLAAKMGENKAACWPAGVISGTIMLRLILRERVLTFDDTKSFTRQRAGSMILKYDPDNAGEVYWCGGSSERPGANMEGAVHMLLAEELSQQVDSELHNPLASGEHVGQWAIEVAEAVSLVGKAIKQKRLHDSGEAKTKDRCCCCCCCYCCCC